jgi:hypothetical protein
MAIRAIGSVALMVALIIAVPHGAPQTFSRWSPLCDGFGQTGGIALGDLDGDGHLDIVVANGQHVAERNWVSFNDGRGTFGPRRPFGAADPSYGVALGDLDGDGDLDIVIANDVGAPSVVYENDGKGNFTLLASLDAGGQARRAVALGDFDGDGALDVVLVGLGQDHIYFNTGRGRRWTERALGSRGSDLARATAVAAADVDGDGDLDIIVPARYGGQSLIYLNDGKGDFTQTRRFGEDFADTTAVAVGDVNGDGHPDIVTGNWEQPHVVYVNDGHGHFTKFSTFGTGQEQTWTLALGDMDLDGDLDVVAGNVNVAFWSEDLNGDGVADRFGREIRSAPTRVYVNDGHGRFRPGPAVTTGGDNTRPIALGDVDGDGDLDLVMGNSCQANYVFFNASRGPKVAVLDAVLMQTRQRWSRAAQNGDRATYTSLLADDAAWIDFTGMLGNKTTLAGASPMRVTDGELDFRQYRSGAVILGVRGGGALRHMQAWVRDGDQWRMAATQEVRVGSQPITFWPPMTVSSPVAASSGAAHDRQAIRASLQSLEAAIETRDVNNVTAMTLPEFVDLTATGEVRHRTDLVAHPGDAQSPDARAGSRIEEDTTRVHGDFAITNRVFRTEKGQRFVQTVVSVRQNRKWTLAARATTLITGPILQGYPTAGSSLSVSSVLPEDRRNRRMLAPYGPRERCGPRLGLGLDRIGPSSQQQCDQLHSAPATRPPEGRTPQELVPGVRARPRIQQHGRQGHAHAMVARDHFVQHRLSRLPGPKIRIAALENQPKRFAAVRLFGAVEIRVPGQRAPQHPEPSRVVPRPVDPLERHAHDVYAPATRAAPEDLLCDRLARERAGLQMRIELAREHPACDLHFAQVPDGGCVDPATMFQHEVDHRRVRCVRAWRTAVVRGKGRRA